MADGDRVRALAMALPGAVDASEGERLAFEANGKGFAWTWLERIEPNKPRRPRPEVLVALCELPRKEMLIAAASDVFFDEGHYRGFPAVLVRLPRIDDVELASLLDSAWRLRTSRKHV
jgi:hypothetical protein